MGYPPGKDMGPAEVLWDGDGVPPTQVWTDKQTETITFPILRMRVVINNECDDFIWQWMVHHCTDHCNNHCLIE